MENKKKILITTGIYPPEIGGPASYCLNIAKKLSEKAEIKIITYSTVRSFSEDKKQGFKIIRIWKKWPKLIRHSLFLYRTLIEARKSDVIYSLNAVSAGLPALWSAKLFKKRLIVKIVGDYAWEIAVNEGRTTFMINDFQKASKTGRIGKLARIQSKVCKFASIVIVPSEYLKELVIGWGVNSAKIKVIYNGSNFTPSSLTKEEARIKIGIPGMIISSVGRLVPWKGFKFLIKMMPQLLEINQFFRLVIIGDGPEKKILETMVKNLRLDRKVYIVGRKSSSELALYLAASDLFVLNTGYEGFSHQLLEAMIAGVPILTTAVGGNKEIIRQGENGFMIKYNDEFNFMEAIKTMYMNKDLRDSFVVEGRETVKKFSNEKMLEETQTILLQ